MSCVSVSRVVVIPMHFRAAMWVRNLRVQLAALEAVNLGVQLAAVEAVLRA